MFNSRPPVSGVLERIWKCGLVGGGVSLEVGLGLSKHWHYQHSTLPQPLAFGSKCELLIIAVTPVLCHQTC